MKKKDAAKAAKRFWGKWQKAAGEQLYVSPNKTKTDGQKDSITDISDAELARLAWQIDPALCKKDFPAAIKLTMQTLLDTREARRSALTDLVADELRPVIEREKNERQRCLDNFRTIGKKDYFRVVKFITDEKNWDRALGKIKRLETARGAKTEKALGKALTVYKNKSFTGTELMRLWEEFSKWWKQEKSKRARKSALAKKRRGKVKRPKSDLRFKENRKHKQGYCRKCGKRVRGWRDGFLKGERLCDECLSGKPLLVNVSVDAEAIKEDSLLDVIAVRRGQVDTSYKHFGEHLDDEPD